MNASRDNRSASRAVRCPMHCTDKHGLVWMGSCCRQKGPSRCLLVPYLAHLLVAGLRCRHLCLQLCCQGLQL
jgi:hypothetical protein